MPPIKEDQIFPSIKDFKEALRLWAIEQNFTPHVLDSDKQRVRVGCRSVANCPFRIRVRYDATKQIAKVTTCEPEHSHPIGEGVSQSNKRTVTGRLAFLVSVVPDLLKVSINTTTREICAVVKQKYGQEIAERQAQKVKRVLTKELKRPCRRCRRFGHVKTDCPQRPAVDSNDEEHETSSEESETPERRRKVSQCSVCFQTGHNKKNCPHKPVVPTLLNDQLQQAAYAPVQPPAIMDNGAEIPPLDDSLPVDSTTTSQQNQSNGQPSMPQNSDLTISNGVPSQAYNSMIPATSVSRRQRPLVNLPTSDGRVGQPQDQTSVQVRPPQTPENLQVTDASLPQDLKLRAAELMRRAAGLTQEAARLNYEAARLIALAPS